jgi:oligopeptide transport system substrate-binding protein
LTRCGPEGVIEPGIAERWELSPDERTWRFHLRASVWSNGAPLTAADFERSWKRAVDPAFPCPCKYLFYPIRNGEAIASGKLSSDLLGVRAIGERLLEVELERPSATFLQLTAYPSYLPISPQGDPLSSPFVSNGPFRVEAFQPQSLLTLRKNPLFWNAPSIRLPGMQIGCVPDETTALQLYERGELDWMGGALCPIPPDALKDPRWRAHIAFHPMAASTFCAFNTQHPFLSIRHIRLALSLAINRQEIVDKITESGQSPATSCIPPALIGGRVRRLYQPVDLERAQLHWEAGLKEWGAADGPPPLVFSFGPSLLDKWVAQAIQRQWKEALGIEVRLVSSDLATHREKLSRRDFEVALGFWIAQYADPMNILERFADPASGKNYPGWDHPPFTALVKQALAARSPIERLMLIEEAEALMAREMPLAPIYHWSNPSLSQPYLADLAGTPSGGILFERCTLEPVHIR